MFQKLIAVGILGAVARALCKGLGAARRPTPADPAARPTSPANPDPLYGPVRRGADYHAPFSVN